MHEEKGERDCEREVGTGKRSDNSASNVVDGRRGYYGVVKSLGIPSMFPKGEAEGIPSITSHHGQLFFPRGGFARVQYRQHGFVPTAKDGTWRVVVSCVALSFLAAKTPPERESRDTQARTR